MKKIILVGQPNSGKSSLFNSLAGSRAVISNYPGTTVEIMQAKAKLNGIRAHFIDTPGIYGLSDSSEEERVAKETILKEKPDIVINIIDATSLERGLFLTLQLLEAQLPLIVALNFYEEAENKGIVVDRGRLEEILGVSVAIINPLTGRGIKHLTGRIANYNSSNSFLVEYDDHIEQAIELVESAAKDGASLPKRFIAIRAIEGDRDLLKYLKSPDMLKKLKELTPHHPHIGTDLAINRHGVAAYIAHMVTSLKRGGKGRSLERFDRLLLNSRFSIPLVSLFFLALFGVLLYLGGLLQDGLSSLFEGAILPPLEGFILSLPSYLGSVIKSALIGTEAGIAIAIPYVGIFYLLLGLLEDWGILPRFMLILDRLMQRIGLPGRALIPMMLGLGCSVPAVRSTRLLSSKLERLKVAILFSVIPCSSRTAIILGVVGHYAGVPAALGIYGIAFILLVCGGYLLKRATGGTPSPLLLELPPYRRPMLSNVLVKSWLRMKTFVYVVIPLLIAGGALYGLLKGFNLVEPLSNPLRFLSVGWLHLPKEAVGALIYGFLQKDLTPAMLFSIAGTSDLASFMSPLQIFTFGLASTFQLPCVIAFLMLIREFGWRWALSITTSALIFGILASGIILRVILLFRGVLG